MRLPSRIGLGLLAVLAAVIALQVRAQQPGPSPAVGDESILVGTAAEQEALASAEAGKFVRAREQAEAILGKDKDSLLANVVLGKVNHDGEANHARALFFTRRAEELLARSFGAAPSSDLAIAWHRRLLGEEAEILMQMDRGLEALAVLDRYRELYGNDREGRRVWVLMKLRRFEEARRVAREMAASEKIGERISGFNGLIAIAGEAHDREGMYAVTNEGIAATEDRSCILRANGAGAALGVLRFAEAEDSARRSLTAEYNNCWAPDYDGLASLYLLEGSFQRAISSLQKLKEAHVEREAQPELSARNRVLLGQLLYALGQLGEAEKIADETYSMPGRTGISSTAVTQQHLATALFYWAVLDARVAQEEERRAAHALTGGAGDDVELARLILRRWEVRHAVLKLAADEEDLVTTIRPYLGPTDPWIAAALVRTVGPGVMTSAIASARALDASVPGLGAYYDAMAVEVAFLGGDLEDTVRQGVAALASLPPEEALIRFRVMAMTADALQRLGRADQARPYYRTLAEQYPTALRLLDLALPVTFASDGSAPAAAASARLASSPRFTAGDTGLRVDATVSDGRLRLCLEDASGSQYACADAEHPGSDDATLTATLAAFQDAAFAPRIDMTAANINSIDGNLARVPAARAVQGLLGR